MGTEASSAASQLEISRSVDVAELQALSFVQTAQDHGQSGVGVVDLNWGSSGGVGCLDHWLRGVSWNWGDGGSDWLLNIMGGGCDWLRGVSWNWDDCGSDWLHNLLGGGSDWLGGGPRA